MQSSKIHSELPFRHCSCYSDTRGVTNDEPMTYTEALMGLDSEKWLGAIESKIESMHNNQVWNLVDPIDGVRAISCKWVF
jgi:hypothetical protein